MQENVTHTYWLIKISYRLTYPILFTIYSTATGFQNQILSVWDLFWESSIEHHVRSKAPV